MASGKSKRGEVDRKCSRSRSPRRNGTLKAQGSMEEVQLTPRTAKKAAEQALKGRPKLKVSVSPCSSSGPPKKDKEEGLEEEEEPEDEDEEEDCATETVAHTQEILSGGHVSAPEKVDPESDDEDYSTGTSSSSSGPKVVSPQRPRRPKDEVPHFSWTEGMVLNSRFEVLRFLGDGTFGRVLLARDSKRKREVAVKIIRNVEKYVKNAKREAEILKDIREADPKSSVGCVKLHDYFWHREAEIDYFCMAFEVLGPSLLDLLKKNRYRGLWMQDIQTIADQCLTALRFLHEEMNLTHTDLKLENVLFASSAPFRPAEFLREDFWQRTKRNSRRPISYVRPASTRIKLIDFGNATYELEHHSSIINTRQYRAPEVILALGWDEVSDLWSLGCILMEIYTGELLFRTHETVEHLALMEKALHPIPRSMLKEAGEKAKGLYLFKDDDGQWRIHWPERATSSSIRLVQEQPTLHQLVMPEHKALADFVSSMLTLDPEHRPSAKKALSHRFLFENFDD